MSGSSLEPLDPSFENNPRQKYLEALSQDNYAELMSPCSMATATACVLLTAFSFCMMLVMWKFTVLSPICSIDDISQELLPFFSQLRTSFSLRERAADGELFV